MDASIDFVRRIVPRTETTFSVDDFNNAYITEDELFFYSAEDGSTIYVLESP